MISLRRFCPRARWAFILSCWTVEEGASVRSSPRPFNKCTLFESSHPPSAFWRFFTTSAMNLYFTLWAQAKQEYMVWEPCKPRLRVHMGVIHHDMWYLHGYDGSSKPSLGVIPSIMMEVSWKMVLTLPTLNRTSRSRIETVSLCHKPSLAVHYTMPLSFWPWQIYPE